MLEIKAETRRTNLFTNGLRTLQTTHLATRWKLEMLVFHLKITMQFRFMLMIIQILALQLFLRVVHNGQTEHIQRLQLII
ncbi:hypothetical protein O71_04066 [Pontibacter sp. BAB1700]|nr:hypothetical protein O71_04066 [Pontibacter sp. BAB1700]